MIQKNDTKTKNNIWCLPICIKCNNLMTISSFILNAKRQLTLLFSCKCTQKGHIVVKRYYEQLRFYYNTTTQICECLNNLSICYCFKCEQYVCKDCYLKHKWHFLLKTEIKNYNKICKCFYNYKNLIYCSICEQLFCKTCSKDLHKNHKLIPFQKINVQLKKASSQESINLVIEKITSSITPQYQQNVKDDLITMLSLIAICFTTFEKYPNVLFIKYQSILKLTNLKTEKVFYAPRYQIPVSLITRPPSLHLPMSAESVNICLLDNGKFVYFDSAFVLIIYSKYFDSIEFSCKISPMNKYFPLPGNELLLTKNNSIEIYDCNKKPKKLIHSEYPSQFKNDCKFGQILEISKVYYIINNANKELLLWNRKLNTYTKLLELSPELEFKMIKLKDDKVIIFTNKELSLWSTKTWEQLLSLPESFFYGKNNNYMEIFSVMEGENNKIILSGVNHNSPKPGYLCYLNIEDLSIAFWLEGWLNYNYNKMKKISKHYFLGITDNFNFAEIVEIETGITIQHIRPFCPYGPFSTNYDYFIQYNDIFIFVRACCYLYILSFLC